MLERKDSDYAKHLCTQFRNSSSSSQQIGNVSACYPDRLDVPQMRSGDVSACRFLPVLHDAAVSRRAGAEHSALYRSTANLLPMRQDADAAQGVGEVNNE